MQPHVQSTLLELVSTLNSFMDSDHEIVALVTYFVIQALRLVFNLPLTYL